MQTQHYGFKLFEAAEKPTWLTDWNNTMNKIDSTIARLTGGGGDTPDLAELTQRVQALEGRVDSDELRLNEVEGNIVDMLQTLSDVQTALTTLETNTQQSLSDMSDDISDLSRDLTALSETVSSLTTSLSTLSGRVSDAETDITALDTRVTSAEGDITQNTSAINGLDTRVTALEGQSGGGGAAGTSTLALVQYIGPSSITATHQLQKGDIIISPYGNITVNSGAIHLDVDTSKQYYCDCGWYRILNSGSTTVANTLWVVSSSDGSVSLTDINASYGIYVFRPFTYTAMSMLGSNIAGYPVRNAKGYLLRGSNAIPSATKTGLLTIPYSPLFYTSVMSGNDFFLPIHPDFSFKGSSPTITTGVYMFRTSEA